MSVSAPGCVSGWRHVNVSTCWDVAGVEEQGVAGVVGEFEVVGSVPAADEARSRTRPRCRARAGRSGGRTRGRPARPPRGSASAPRARPATAPRSPRCSAGTRTRGTPHRRGCAVPAGARSSAETSPPDLGVPGATARPRGRWIRQDRHARDDGPSRGDRDVDSPRPRQVRSGPGQASQAICTRSTLRSESRMR